MLWAWVRRAARQRRLFVFLSLGNSPRFRCSRYTGFKRFVSNGKSAIIEGRDNVADAWAGACL